MNTGTGKMIPMDVMEELKKAQPKVARFYKQIPDKFLPELAGMNRGQRRLWYKKNKKRIKEGA